MPAFARYVADGHVDLRRGMPRHADAMMMMMMLLRPPHVILIREMSPVTAALRRVTFSRRRAVAHSLRDEVILLV